MNNHKDFILSPITDILIDVVLASSGIGNGIETYPMCDYVMQSVFVKMTGFQEQKLKCICWELATIDFEYRYDHKTKTVGDRSSYADKQSIYKDLIEYIKKHLENFNVQTDINKSHSLATATDNVKSIFENTNLSVWSENNFNEYLTIWSEVEEKHFANDDTNLFTATGNNEISLQRIYRNHLYKHRNKIAHNTQSYQQNLPTLKTLVDENYKYENYFIWFSLLVLIDEIFRELYQIFLNTFDDN